MLKLIADHHLWGFAIYTAALGAFVLIQSTMLGNPAFASLNPFA